MPRGFGWSEGRMVGELSITGYMTDRKNTAKRSVYQTCEWASMDRVLPSIHKALGSILSTAETGHGAHTCEPNTLEVGTRELGVQGHPWLLASSRAA